MNRSAFLLLFLSASLSACGGGPGDPGPGGVSNEDAKALDEAASKLDADTASQTN